jgi:glucose/mannose-6-phosphate isomerase
MDTPALDTQNMAEAIYDFPNHLADAIELGKNFSLTNSDIEIRNIVVAGMGGSAIGGDVCRVLIASELNIPFVVNRNYTLPNWVNEHTLVICSSYSGNTEETLSAFTNAQAKGTQICGISTGGTLTEKLNTNGSGMMTIPAGLQPRAALAFSVVPMLYLLKAYGLIGDSIFEEINNTITLLKSERLEYAREDSSNSAFALASNIYKTLPIIYGTADSTAVAALRWKGQFCENANMLAYHNELPEMNHNELVGWDNNAELFKHMSVLWLTDSNDHKRVQLRQDITRRIMGQKNENQHVIAVKGSSEQVRLLHLIHFGDWVSYWCAILHGTDPSPVVLIEELKAELSSK